MKKWKKIAIFAVAIAMLLCSVELYISNACLQTTVYTLQFEQIVDDLNIVFLSDLHNDSFGMNQRRLIEEVRCAAPAIIAVVGDMMEVDSDEDDLRDFKKLLKNFVSIAPTYVSYGNHDLQYETSSGVDFAQEIRSTGATLLDESYVDVTVGNSKVRIGGLYAYAFLHHQTMNEWINSETYRFLKEFEDTDLPTVLLCHRPDSFIFYDAYLDWNIDIILSGHTHGGIVRIPFAGGLIASDQGYFPEYDYGEYYLDDTVLLITSGLDGYGIIPRIFNRPEIVKLTLKNG